MTGEEGPPHERVVLGGRARRGRELGSGRGRSKKHAEQEAARMAVEQLAPVREPRGVTTTSDRPRRCA